MIVGRSIHNQRIECLWRDVFQGTLKFYYGLFYHLESIGILDPNSDMDPSFLSSLRIPTPYKSTPLYVEGCLEHAHTEN